MKIAFVTGGGDCAGINSALARAVLHGARKYNDTFVGVRKAFEGLAADNIDDYVLDLDTKDALEIFDSPSTILGSSRFAPFSEKNNSWAPQKILDNMKKLGIDAIIATGGNDTVSSALGVHGINFPIIAIPKSIDNDISGTDWMLGASTAIDFATKAFKSTSVSAQTHARISINEVMGRKAGWLAFYSGVASGADIILVPEKSFSLKELVEQIKKLEDKNGFVDLVASEGINFNPSDAVYQKAASANAPDKILHAMLTEAPEFDPHGNIKLGGAGIILQHLLAMELGVSLSRVRQSNIGFALRGLRPNAFDINLGQRFGRKAIELLHNGETGLMVGIRGMKVVNVPMAEALPQFTLDAMDEEELRDLGVFF
ncbi:MAG: hypothetical protein GXO75_11950 [Calditrichaeota bacterium]|nr:hypothetical protein [Calditrichota bacterium]